MTATTPVGVRPDWVDDELFPFKSRFVELDGNIVHYVDEGSGPTLLLAVFYLRSSWPSALIAR